VVGLTDRPLMLSVLQYAVCAVAGLAVAVTAEGITFDAIIDNWFPLFYTGVLSGGVAYTLQAVAQRHTPSADAGIILSSEALFAAIAGVILMGDHLSWMGGLGCVLILAAILLVEVGSFFTRRRKSA